MNLQLPGGLSVPADLMEIALTHSSFAREHPGTADNERLEFLGDAVISLAYSEYLFRTFPNHSEGRLALARATAVSAHSLARAARRLGLGEWLRLGRGAEKNGDRDRDSVLADAFEAVVGAIYLGCGWEAARNFVVDRLACEQTRVVKDYKSRLQELLQATSRQEPVYTVSDTSGPDHAKQFTVSVTHQGAVLGQGRGSSKKEAEQAAARAALSLLEKKRESEN